MNFTESQLKAINHKDGPCLVLAVPGSGKTTVLLARINNLISHGVSPSEILSMTFSKSQAIDMQNRFIENYDNQSIYFSTIHSFAYGILKSFHKNNKHLQIIESSNIFNKYNLIKQIYLHINHKKMNDDQLEEFFRVSSFIKNSLMDYDNYKSIYGKAFFNFEKVYIQYEKFKKEKNLIDFDDMLIEALRILQTNKNAVSYLRNRFKYIQIDEGQDTSLVQLKIISIISSPLNNLFVVADDDQSIYGFRGALSKLLLDFPKIYHNAKVYYMQDNFRSTKNIAEVSNKLIYNNINRYKKSIKVNKLDGDDVKIKIPKNTFSQTQEVLSNSIRDINNGKSVAILYRNNISLLNFLNNIPKNINYSIKEKKNSFFTHPIIIDIINTINFSKDLNDIILFENIYYKFNLYLKKEFIEQIKFMSSDKNIIERLMNVEGLNEFFIEKIYDLDIYLEHLSKLNFHDSINYILHTMDYYNYLKELARRNSISILAYDRIIDTLLNITKEIKTVSEFQNLSKKLYSFSNVSNSNSMLTLSTIHGAKGLEFDSVYMVDLIQYEFPSSQNSSIEEPEFLEEERRLFYVGLTRAKENLSLYYPKSLNYNKTEPSQFLKEIMD